MEEINIDTTALDVETVGEVPAPETTSVAKFWKTTYIVGAVIIVVIVVAAVVFFRKLYYI